MNRDEGRRACGVQRDARPSEIEHVRKAIGQHRQRGRGRGMCRDPVAVSQIGLEGQVVHHETADEHSRARTGVVARGLAGVLERLPAALQEQTLLRIQNRRLPGRDPEECVVERLRVLGEHSGLLHVASARRPAGGVEVFLGVPAAAGNVDDAVAAVEQSRPQPVRIGDTARQPAPDADDRDRFTWRKRIRHGRLLRLGRDD